MKTPAEYFNLPIIGTITTKKINGHFIPMERTKDMTIELMSFPEEELEIIAEEEHFFVCNQWYKEYSKKPQLIAKAMVKSINLTKTN